MEKLLYPLWKKPAQSAADFRQLLLGPVSEDLLNSGVRQLRLSIVDADVEPAAALRQQNIQPLMDAMISIWVDSANTRHQQQAIIAKAVERYHGYLVTESEALVNTEYPTAVGERTYGMSQVVFLQRPEKLNYQQWLDIWLNSHTTVAIETQSTFSYRQNVVVRKLTEDSADIDAIIEESFPPEAMASQHVFYDAVNADGSNNDEKCQANAKAMVDSVVRFIDFEKLDVIPTSEYLIQ